MKYLIATLFLAMAIGPVSMQSQDKKTTISLVDFYLPTLSDITKQSKVESNDNPYYTKQQPPEKLRQKLDLLPSIVADYFGKDDRFKLIDRKTTDLIHKERELQKSEDFLDGYVVAQGQSIGVEYLISGEFDMQTNMLNLTLYSVAEQNIVGTETVELYETMFVVFAKPIREPVLEGLRRLCARAFPLFMPVVEITVQKKDEARAILIAGGLGRGLRKGTKLDIKIKETRPMDDGNQQTYYRTIGTGTVEKVEDQNFSILNVDTGEKEVKSRLDGGAKLYCTFQI